MTLSTDDLCALLGSRLCHDLISPIGAISNGMELLEMTTSPTPEMELIRQSVDNVNARIRYFRIAFGMASAEQSVGTGEITGILKAYFAAGRVSVDWNVTEDVPRAEAKAAFLAILCIESALPAGGTITVDRSGQIWTLAAQAEKFRIDPVGWDHLNGAAEMPTAANSVHFGLLRHWGIDSGRSISAKGAEDGVHIQLG